MQRVIYVGWPNVFKCGMQTDRGELKHGPLAAPGAPNTAYFLHLQESYTEEKIHSQKT